MAEHSHITLEVRGGSVLRATMDVLDLAQELADMLPEWHQDRRAEMQARIAGLNHFVRQAMRVTDG